MNKNQMKERGEKVLMNTYKRGDKILVEGHNTYVKDIEGNTYLDFISGIATNVLGHADDSMVEAIHTQASKLIHSSNLFWNKPSIELAEKLVEKSGLDKVFFSNSGAESNEGAIKLARKWGRENKSEDAINIVTMKESFHGRTMATLTATGQTTMHKNFLPTLQGFKYVSFNDSAALENKIDEKTCAIMIETIQGEGGINTIADEYIETINKLQQEKKILLIIDEIQTGMGRTGSYFSYKDYKLDPDIITLAKGLGGGFPIGAFLAKEEVADHFSPGDHGTTFGGNPLATAVGNHIIDTIEQDDLLKNVKERSRQFVEGLEALQNKYNFIENIKGKGLLIGVKLSIPVKDVIDTSYKRHLLVASSKGNVLRILPPLNVSKEEVEEGLEILEKVFKEINHNQ